MSAKQLSFKKYGEKGPAVVILHGLFGTADNWHSLATRFGEHFRVWAPDLRNHGRSPHDDSHTYADMAADTAEFIRREVGENVHLLGHSMGGKAAMEMSFRRPELLHSLTILDIAPKGYDASHNELMDAMCNLRLEDFSTRAEADAALAREVPSEAVRLFLLKNMARGKDNTFHWKINLPALIRHYEEIIGPVSAEGTYSGPALFVGGEKSDYIQQEDHAQILEAFPQAQFATVSGAGHWVNADNPDGLYDIVVPFWQKLNA